MDSFCFLFEANQVSDCIQIKIVCVCVYTYRNKGSVFTHIVYSLNSLSKKNQAA